MRFSNLIIYPLTLILFLVLFSWASHTEQKTSQEESGRRIEVLFLGSENRSNHDPPTRFRVLREALGPKAVNITYAHTLDALTEENLAKYDVLLIFANQYTIDKKTQGKALLDFARDGGGCVLLHCAAGCFRDSNFDEYVELLGAQFKSHGKGVFRAKIVNTEHPIMKAWDGFECWDETYEHKRHGKDRIILQTRNEEPWTWVKTYGKGKVFYTASGHDHRCWDLPEFHDLVHRAIRWTAKEDPDRYLDTSDLPILEYRAAKAPKDPEKPVGPLNEIQNSLSPEESLKLAQVPPGFELKLFASEPEIVNPISMNWDKHGRLWVVEAFDYPHKSGTESPHDRIKILEDKDGDGKADQVTTFATGLNICTSVLPLGDGALATDGANLVYLRDLNGDDKADEKQIIWSGIGLRDTHACVSNLRLGFDGWIYATVGYSGLKVSRGNEIIKSTQGVFRFQPDGEGFEILQNTSNNTWGVAFTEQGDVVGSTANGNPSWYLSIPNHNFEMLGRKPQQVAKADLGELLAPITSDYFQNNPKGVHSSGAGHAIYTAERFPKEWWNQRALVCEPPLHLVSAPRFRNEADRFKTTNFEHNLYASSDAWSAPVVAEVGPDGAVWIADWYNPICNHNPYRKHLELGAGNAFLSDDRDREHGRIYRVFPTGSKDEEYPPLRNTSECVKALANPNLFWRLQAQWQLNRLAKKDELMQLAKDASNWKIRLHLLAAASDGELDGVQIAGLARRLQHEKQVSQPWAEATQVHFERLADKTRHPLDRKAAALLLVTAKADPDLGAKLGRLFLSEPALQKNHHLADAIRLAIIRHPEGFLRSLLGDEATAENKALKRIINDVMTRFDTERDILSEGLKVVIRQSEERLAKRLQKLMAKKTPTQPDLALSQSAKRGQLEYISCVACHQPNGQGLDPSFPPLAGSKRLTANPKTAIKIVLKGIAGPLSASERQYNGIMPGHETILNDQQIADVLSYTRSAWGNKANDISVDMVRKTRAEVADRKDPWKERDLK